VGLTVEAQGPASPPAAGAAATAPAAPTTLVIAGDVRTPLTITPADLKGMPRTRVDVKGEDGRMVIYEGVLVGERLTRAGAPLGRELRGDALASYVVAIASDGYRVVFSLAELDPAMTANEVIVADTVEGNGLFAYQGPLRLVAPKDARPARGVRMLQRLEV